MAQICTYESVEKILFVCLKVGGVKHSSLQEFVRAVLLCNL